MSSPNIASPSAVPHLQYRPDIDGLRAVAVLSVVLFHFDPELVPGGFVGVDIFFVISGFLITGNIWRQREAGRFSLADFYRRRIRRIFPALTAVVLGTLLVGQILYLPEDLHKLGLAALASQLSVANIYFTWFLDTSYFADDAQLQPLLHLWSLGVEEQFYLFWPLTLLWLLSLRSSVTWTLLVTTVLASFLLGELLVAEHAMFAYYMLPTRAGELLIGAWCFLGFKEWQGSQTSRSALALAGVGLTTWSLYGLSESQPFPGLNALYVSLGSAAIILAGINGGRTVVNRVLEFRAFVWVGLISYSMYLWHWPTLAFARYVQPNMSNSALVAMAVVLVLLSWFSWRFVEQPFRHASGSPGRIAIRLALVPVLLVTGLTVFVFATQGLGAYAWSDYQSRLARELQPQQITTSDHVCLKKTLGQRDVRDHRCVINAETEPGILLWGDSNAAHYVPLLDKIATHYGFGFRNATHSACPPVLSEPEQFVIASYKMSCRNSGAVVREILGQYPLVMMSGTWQQFDRTGRFEAVMIDTLTRLSDNGQQVVLIGRIPRFLEFDRLCAAKALKVPLLDCDAQTQSANYAFRSVNQRLEALASRFKNVRYMDFNTLICPEGVCSSVLDGDNLYYDSGHLSLHGAGLLGQAAVAQGINGRLFAELREYSAFPSTRTKNLNDLQSSAADRQEISSTNLLNSSLLDLSRITFEWTPDGLLLSDTMIDRYMYIRIDDLPSIVGSSNGRAQLKLRISSIQDSESEILIRLLVPGNKNQDYVIDPKSPHITTMGDALFDRIRVRHEGDDQMVITLDYPLGVEELPDWVAIFPAATGAEAGQYSVTGTGSLMLEEFTVSVLDSTPDTGSN